MIVTTTENIPGMRVTRVIGQMFGLTVRTRGVGGNIAAQFRGLAGGEVKSYTKLLEDARREAVDRLVQSATAAGANAVVMMRFELLGDGPDDERDRRLRHRRGRRGAPATRLTAVTTVLRGI